jgi:hypothetical protein
METHLHVVQPFQAPVVQPDRRRRDHDAPPFELESKPAKEPVAREETLVPAPRAANEEGVGESVDVVA